MSWDVVTDFLLKYWIGILTAVVYPIGRWVNKKRREYLDLTDRVKTLENRVGSLESRVDTGFTDISLQNEKLLTKLDEMQTVLYEVRQDTAVNKARIDNK